MTDYLLSECRVAAKWIVDSIREMYAVRPLAIVPRVHRFETLECNLIDYFQGCMDSARNCGSYRQSWSGSFLADIFPAWAKSLKRIGYVVIEPGKVGVRLKADKRSKVIIVAAVVEVT